MAQQHDTRAIPPSALPDREAANPELVPTPPLEGAIRQMSAQAAAPVHPVLRRAFSHGVPQRVAMGLPRETAADISEARRRAAAAAADREAEMYANIYSTQFQGGRRRKKRRRKTRRKSRRKRRRKSRRKRRRKRRRRRTRRGGKFVFDYIKKQVKEDDKRRHRAAIQGWHHRLEYPKYVHTLPRKTSTHKTSRHTRRQMKRVSVTPRRTRSYMWAHRDSKHRKKMEHADRWVEPEHWTASRRKYKVKKSRKSRKSSKKN